jgi:endonuclease/exonuclease/phosphatase family metal-dependent hydrolase
VNSTIVSYNIQIPAAKEELHPWVGRKQEVLDCLPHLGDLIGLQEVDYNTSQGSEISERLTEAGFNSFQPGYGDSEYTDEYHTRIPIFWKKEHFKLIRQEVRMLTTGTVEQQKLLPNIEARYTTYVQLECSGQPLHFFNLHQQHVPMELTDQNLITGYKAVQNAGLQSLHDFIRELNPNGDRTFIVGDFNATEPHVNGYNDAYRVAQHTEHSEYNSYHGYQPSGGSEGGYIIDHVLTNLTQDNVLNAETIIAEKGSDHYPIRVTVT